jgi:hypothetical protein
MTKVPAVLILRLVSSHGDLREKVLDQGLDARCGSFRGI